MLHQKKKHIHSQLQLLLHQAMRSSHLLRKRRTELRLILVREAEVQQDHTRPQCRTCKYHKLHPLCHLLALVSWARSVPEKERQLRLDWVRKRKGIYLEVPSAAVALIPTAMPLRILLEDRPVQLQFPPLLHSCKHHRISHRDRIRILAPQKL